MKTQKIFVIAACAFTLSLAAQTTEKRNIGSFTKIEASGAASINYATSASPALSIEGDAEEIKQVETTVKNNVLYIKTKGNFKHPLKINVSGANLSHLGLSGACNFVATGALKTDELTIESSGASKIEMHLNSKSLSATLDGASQMDLHGSTQTFKSNVSGASNLKAYDLKALTATVTASGASNAQVYVTESLSSKSSGASNIQYKGNPKTVDKTTTSVN